MDRYGLGRRDFFRSAGIAGAGAAVRGLFDWTQVASAQQAGLDTIVFLGHAVHRQVLKGERGGRAVDLLGPIMKTLRIKQDQWITYDTDQIHDRLFREAVLPRTTIDIGFLLNSFASPRIQGLFEPLDEWNARKPIEDFGDLFPEMVKNNAFGGHIYGIPMRATNVVLHYNHQIFTERGVNGPPRTVEELFDAAKRCTFTRPNGAKVYGYIGAGTRAEVMYTLISFVRAWDGDFVTRDYKVVVNEPPVVNALTMLQDMFKAGVLPPDFTTIATAQQTTLMQTGQGAMTNTGTSNNLTYNDPKTSKVPGQVSVAPFPLAKNLVGKIPSNPSSTEFWSFVIPKRAPHKEISWELVRYFSSKQIALAMALNGNSSTRGSTYGSQAYRDGSPNAALELTVLKTARTLWPPFDNVPKAIDALGLAVHEVLLGQKSPKLALDEAALAIEKLVPKHG